MKAKTLLIIGGVILAGGTAYWLFTRGTTTTGQAHVPGGVGERNSQDSWNVYKGVAGIISAAGGVFTDAVNAFRSDSPEDVDQGTGQAASTGGAASILN